MRTEEDQLSAEGMFSRGRPGQETLRISPEAQLLDLRITYLTSRTEGQDTPQSQLNESLNIPRSLKDYTPYHTK